jgi:hypothetical protein
MSIKNDYLLEMVARFVEALVTALERARLGRSAEAIGDYEGLVGEALDMDAEVVLELAPPSLVAMMQISAVDDTMAGYTVYALGRAADLREEQGDAVAQLRREQAACVAEAYGLEASYVPPELEEALASRG